MNCIFCSILFLIFRYTWYRFAHIWYVYIYIFNWFRSDVGMVCPRVFQPDPHAASCHARFIFSRTRLSARLSSRSGFLQQAVIAAQNGNVSMQDIDLKGSLYGIFTCIWLMSMVDVTKYAIHGSYGDETYQEIWLPYCGCHWGPKFTSCIPIVTGNFRGERRKVGRVLNCSASELKIIPNISKVERKRWCHEFHWSNSFFSTGKGMKGRVS